MNTKARTCEAAGKAHWELAAFHRSIGQVSRSQHYAALAQTYYAMQQQAECEEKAEAARKRRLFARWLS